MFNDLQQKAVWCMLSGAGLVIHQLITGYQTRGKPMINGRRRAWLAFAIAGAFVLAACGGTDSATDEVGGTTDVAAALQPLMT